MGVMLPRDADFQERALSAKNRLGDLNRAQKSARIADAPLGSLLFKPGHVMMYLGQDDLGKETVIHSASSYYDFSSGYAEKIYIRRVLVGDLTYKNWQGTETIDSLTGIGTIVK